MQQLQLPTGEVSQDDSLVLCLSLLAKRLMVSCACAPRYFGDLLVAYCAPKVAVSQETDLVGKGRIPWLYLLI